MMSSIPNPKNKFKHPNIMGSNFKEKQQNPLPLQN